MTDKPRVHIFTEEDAGGDDERAGFSPNGAGTGPADDDTPHASAGPDYNIILGAPDFATLIKRPKTQKSREYERRAGSALKLVFVGALQSGQMADAATILYHGPGAATAIGDMCDASDTAAKIVDALTSPNSPWAMFALTTIPLVAQLFRNHEQTLQQVPNKVAFSRKARQMRREAKAARPQQPPRFTLHFLGKTIPVRFRLRFNLGRVFAGVRTQTKDPNELALAAFGDQRVLDALAKQGIHIAVVPRDE